MLTECKEHRLIVASEYALDREAICRILKPCKDIKIIALVSKSKELQRLISARIEAELLLLDADMKKLDLIKILRLIRKELPSLKVLLLFSKYDEEKVIRALCAGALGYILKNADSSEFLKSVRALLSGEVWIPRKTMAKVISGFSSCFIEKEAVSF